MSKVQEAIFNITPYGGYIYIDERSDLHKYLLENERVEQVIQLKRADKMTEKERLYAFLFGPLMSVAITGYTNAGYPAVDKVKARFLLEAELSKYEVYSPAAGKTKVYTRSVSDMGAKELLEFIVNVIYFLEAEFKVSCPDAEEYKMRLKAQRELKRIK